MKVPNAKALALFNKLKALAERGIDGEKLSAQAKLALLMTRFDFSSPDLTETPDLFRGQFKRSNSARLIYSFKSNEFDIANSVKWAIESATKIQCIYRGNDLLAEAAARTADRLTEIAAHIAGNFRALVEQFSAIAGVSVSDRSVFVRGLYDGMMNQVRGDGQSLPKRPAPRKQSKAKKRGEPPAPTLHIHPYTVAVGLGKQIRFSVSLDKIAADLDAVTRKHLGSS